jgi:Zn ribbon nucleic-acid-binding protein
MSNPRTCPGCKTTYHTSGWFADEDPKTECSTCAAKRVSKPLVKEINAAVAAGKLLSAMRRYPKRPAERHFIEKARTTQYGHTEVRWLHSHVWQSIKRDEIKGLA